MAETTVLTGRQQHDGLSSPAFGGLLTTQCFGALNDNMFRWLAVPIAKPVLGTAEALSLGLACFTLPYLLLAGLAGFLADRFSKRAVIVGCKVAEAVIMGLGVVAILSGSVTLLFVVVALMGCQSALFGPSKFGSIPELVDHNRISKANGWMALITVIASALGFVAGNFLFSLTQPDITRPGTLADLWLIPVSLLGVAAVGWAASLLVTRVPAADPQRRLMWNPAGDTWNNLRRLAANRPLMRAALGIAFFWMLASLAQMNIDVFGMQELQLEQRDIGLLLGILVAGVGIGSVLAGYWSGGKVELGIVPLGALGIVVSSGLLYLCGKGIDPTSADAVQSAFVWSCVWLFLLGVSAGLFNIPLEAFLQERSERQHRGVILAAGNFLSFSLILLSAGLFLVLQKTFNLSASDIFLVAAVGTLPVLVYIVVLLPTATIRFLVWLVAHTVYKVRVTGEENVPESGGALLVANHVSWIDAVLLMLTSSRPVRMLGYADYVNNWKLRWLARLFGVIPIKAEAGPKELLGSLQAAREALKGGDVVCIFAEGSITRSGQLQPFQRGLLHIVKGTDAPVIPVYLDGLWGSVFSYRGGQAFRPKPRWPGRPRRWPYHVSISFGPALTEPNNVHQIRSAVQNLGARAMEQRKQHSRMPARRFLHMCRRSLFRSKVADSTGVELTGGKLLTATLVFRRLFRRSGIGRNEEMVGVFLPPCAGAVLANAALTLMRRVAVNLNYTLKEETLNHCIERCNIRHVITSRKFLEKKPYNLNAEVVYVEDLKEQVGLWDKIASMFSAYCEPRFLLERRLRLNDVQPDDLLTVIFTSGSTGEPKGVMLSQNNVLSNIEAIDELFHFTPQDVLLGVLPFFHSFGYTANLWLTLTLTPKAVFHVNPLDARLIGKLCEKHRVTILMSTPTFLRTYLKRCTPEQMKTLDTVVVGAEKLPRDLARAFYDKFGVEVSEGYGTTELSPVAAVNVPPNRVGSQTGDPSTEGIRPETTSKPGTVGRPLPGIAAKVVDPETWQDRGINTEGLLLIKGPNVMKGYLDDRERTDKVLRDGWYDTGDFASLDDDGFISITGRQSRFSKIGGEMVPHVKIEEMLNRILEDPPDDEPRLRAAVTAVPDEKKGERLIVLHTPLNRPVEEVLAELGESDLPNLWIPSREGFIEVPEIPVLGTGKLDLKAVQQLAMEKTRETAGAK